MANIDIVRGRQVVVILTNKSGGGVVEGDVVVVDTTTDAAFTTTTEEGSCAVIGVAAETIADNAEGRVLVGGYAAAVAMDGATNRGELLKTSTTGGDATPTAIFESGVFAVALSATVGAGTVEALLFGPSSGRKGIIGITIGSYGSGVAITTGLKGFVPVPEDCKVVAWTVVADQAGNIVVDVWKDTYANYPPTVADTIAGAEKPTLAGVIKNQDLALGTWTTACAEGDWIGFNVDSVATVEWVCVALHVVYGNA